jgi:hypothetical protein
MGKFALYILSIDVRNLALFDICDTKTHKDVCGESKGKIHPRNGHEGPWGGVEVYFYSLFNLGARWGGWSTPRPVRFTSGKDPVPIIRVLESGWGPQPVWTGSENLSPHRNSIPGPSSQRGVWASFKYCLTYRNDVILSEVNCW